MNLNGVDPVAVLVQLGLDEPTLVAPVSGGRDTAIWRVAHHGSIYALRVFRPEQEPVAAHEVAAMKAARDGGVPVPEVHALGQWRARPAMLLSWAAGHTVIEELQQHPSRAFELGALSGQTLARVHAVPAPEHARQWRSGPGRAEGPFGERLDAIGRNDALLHLDFHPLNLLTDGERISAVLDWTNARSGDPRADLARCISILRLATGDRPAEERVVLRQYERGLRHGYGPVPNLAPFLAWAGVFMLNDITHRLERDPDQRRRVEQWVARWQRRVGVA